MSVLIKDTNMPKNCWLCEFCHDVRYYSETISCCSAQEEKMIFPSKSDRDENCPLVEVPPHGDLIDRDKIWLNDFEIVMCNGDYKEALQMQIKKILDAPAIIEAEEGT